MLQTLREASTSAWSMTTGGRHFLGALNDHLCLEGLQRFWNLGPFGGPSSFDSRTFGRKGTGCHLGCCTKDVTLLEQKFLRLKAGAKEYEKIWKKIISSPCYLFIYSILL